jgi:hypothetical protein
VLDDQGGDTWQKSELRGTVEVAGNAGTLRNTGDVSDGLSLM